MQVSAFLEGLASISEWAVWSDSGEDTKSGLPLTSMLRPLVLEDFSEHLAGDMAPLNVQEWRECTEANGFHYADGHKVGPPPPLPKHPVGMSRHVLEENGSGQT